MKTIKIGAIVLAFLLVITMLPINSLSATSSGEIQNQINELKAEKENIKAQIVQIQEQYTETYNEIANIIAKKNIIDQEIQLLHEESLNIDAQIAAYNILIADKQEELDNAIKDYEELKENSKLRVRAMEERGTLSYWAVIFNANDFSDLLDRVYMVQEIVEADNRLLIELDVAAKKIEKNRKELEQGKKELTSIRKELEDKKTEMEEKRIESEKLIQELLSKAENLEALEADFERQEQEFLNEIANKEVELDAAKEKELNEYLASLVPVVKPQPVPPEEKQPEDNKEEISEGNKEETSDVEPEEKPNGNNDEVDDKNETTEESQPEPEVVVSWIRPCSYILLTSPFGYRDAPTTGASTYHQGVDLAGPIGTPIVAACSGVVSYAGYDSSAGNYIKITHPDGYSSVYMHLSTINVSTGDMVAQGEQIGGMGSTGVSTGSHLHFGIMKDGVYVNPASYISF